MCNTILYVKYIQFRINLTDVNDAFLMITIFYSPEIDVTWETPKNRGKLFEFNTRLQILLVTKDDSGNYLCTGTNAAGKVTETIKVEIKCK